MMTSTIRKFGVGVASIALVAGAAAPAFAADPVNNRLSGSDRYDTAIAVAMDSTEFANPSVVYVSRGDALVDAVTAGAMENGPMLLVNDDAAVQDKVAAAIKKLSVSKVVVIGGEKAVSKETVEKIVPTGVVTERISGDNRYETAVKIAETMIPKGSTTLPETKTVYLANGTSLVDALVGGQLLDGPILLTDGSGKLPEATAKALNTKFYNSPVVALGGTQVVTQAELTAANVSKVIIPETFIQDFAAEIKAAAVAGMKVNGYVTVSNKAKKADVLAAVPNNNEAPVVKAKIEATWPQIDRTYAPTGNFYVPTKADGTVDTNTAQPAAMSAAPGYKAETLDDGAKALSYAGTTQAATDAATAFTKAKAAVDTLNTNLDAGQWGGASKMFNASIHLEDAASTGNNGKEFFEAWTDLFGPLKDVNNASPMQDILKAVLPTDKFNTYVTLKDSTSSGNPANSTYKSGKEANVLSDLKAKVTGVDGTARVAGLQAKVVEAASANDAAKKAKKAADDTLSDRLVKRLPSGALDRIAGTDRYSTSVAIATAVFGEKGGKKAPSRIYFANGEAFADAAVSGMLTKGPVLLVGKDMIPGVVNDYAKDVSAAVTMSRKNIVALGGDAVISDKNLTDELDILAPIGASKDYSVSFSPVVLTGHIESDGAVDSSASTIKIENEVKNAPNGGNKVVVWQINTGDGWKDITAQTATGKVNAGKFEDFNTDTLKVTGNGNGETMIKVRQAVKSVNANNDELVATQYSTAVEFKA